MYLYATLVPRDALAVLSYLASYVLETLAKIIKFQSAIVPSDISRLESNSLQDAQWKTA